MNYSLFDIASFLSETNEYHKKGRLMPSDFSHAFPYSYRMYYKIPWDFWNHPTPGVEVEDAMSAELSKYR